MVGNLKSAGPFAQDRRVSWGGRSAREWPTTPRCTTSKSPTLEWRRWGLISMRWCDWASPWPTTVPSVWGWASCTRAMAGFVAPTKASTRRRRSSLFASSRRLVDACTWTVQRPRISGLRSVWGWVDATMQRTAGTSTAFKSSSPKPHTSCLPAMVSRPKRRSSTTEPCAPIPTPTLRRTPLRPTCWTAFSLG